MSLDLHFTRPPQGVEVREVGTRSHWEYASEWAEWEGDTSQAYEVFTPVWGLFIDGVGVPSTNLYKYPDGTYSISARCESAGLIKNRLQKAGKKIKIY